MQPVGLEGVGMEEGILGGIFAGLGISSFLGLILGYIFLGFAFMAIGKKAGLSMPALAWIPFFGPMIIAFQASKMHWWPWLLYIGMILGVFNVYIYYIASLIFFVMYIIWIWKMFEAIKKPGWWAILCLIPIVNIILISIAAWGKD